MRNKKSTYFHEKKISRVSFHDLARYLRNVKEYLIVVSKAVGVVA